VKKEREISRVSFVSLFSLRAFEGFAKMVREGWIYFWSSWNTGTARPDTTGLEEL
jgi:hypothetical protein